MHYGVILKMKNLWNSLYSLGIVATPFVIFGLTWWLSHSVFHLSPTYCNVIAFGNLTSIFVGVFWWMNKLNDEELQIINTFEHSFFGIVEQRRESWDALMALPNFTKDISITSYENNIPTETQERTVNWISLSFNLISDEIQSALKSAYTHLPDDIELDYEHLMLDPEEYQSFILVFEIEGIESLCGFSASYSYGVFDDLEEMH